MRAFGVLVVVSVSLLAGCVSANSVSCDDGRVCPSNYTCTRTGCATAAELAACVGRADGETCVDLPGTCVDGACTSAICANNVVEPGEACDDGNVVNGDGCNGTCTSDESCGNGVSELAEECDCGTAERPGSTRCAGTFNGGELCTVTCVLRRCGDHEIDPGEVCDDGNRDPGDGCNFDCTSTEICGNGTTDFFVGERCDDSNLRDRDGCSSTCEVEELVWSLEDHTATPPTRYAATMAYDAARRRVVLFGGSGAVSLLGDTWEHDGRTWIRIATSTSPPPRRDAVMAYDAARGRMVLFGGNNGNKLDDTWTFDGVTWTEQSPATRPPALTQATMSYDTARGRIVLFGGAGPTGRSDETWEHDGTTWTKRTLSPSPPARDKAMMTYDPRRGRMVLFGGGNASNAWLDDTWEYDGVAWTAVTPAVKPSTKRWLSGMAYDLSTGKVVLFGGHYSAGASGHLDETWEYDGATWVQRLPTARPSPRLAPAMTYDAERQRIVVFGGAYIDGTTTSYGDTWHLDPATWTPSTQPPKPSGRSAAGLAYDAGRGRVVLFGGNTLNGPPDNETWELDGVSWSKYTGASPSPRADAAMTYDPHRRRVVLFGGSAGAAETWEFDGVTWSERTLSPRPSDRESAAMAYDALRGRAVLFGGSAGAAETWELDTSGWTLRSPAQSPPGRRDAGLVYDASRGVIVMFGGRTSNVPRSDTWEYDGTTWTERVLALHPPATIDPIIAYDPVRARVVLSKGAVTWEYDGTAWIPTTLASSPPADDGAMVYDTANLRMVMFHGFGLMFPAPDVWVLRHEQLRAAEVCSSGIDYDGDAAIGCADTDCWPHCSPLCAPAAPPASCPAAPACGDGVCTGVEDCRSCPADCAVDTPGCPVLCGDLFCDAPGETAASCPGDCL